MIRKTDPAAIAPYLKDASNFMRGRAAEVVIPETREELAAFLKSNDQPITIAGSGTGLTASRIPLAGRVVSLEKFNQLQNPEDGFITCGPAVRLKDLQAKLKGTGWFYTPNPTETQAS
ncbi:MAG: FAD-binding oxidoreductase, partial [Nitrospinaceae bacterium]